MYDDNFTDFTENKALRNRMLKETDNDDVYHNNFTDKRLIWSNTTENMIKIRNLYYVL